MKKTTFTFLALSTLLLGVVLPATAQSIRISSNIPFEFVYGDTAMPAGEYTLVANAVNGTVSIQSYDQEVFASRLSSAVSNPNLMPDGRARLVFNRYGNQYFLSEIWSGYGSQGREFTPSRTERELARTAGLHQRETVTVLARR